MYDRVLELYIIIPLYDNLKEWCWTFKFNQTWNGICIINVYILCKQCSLNVFETMKLNVQNLWNDNEFYVEIKI